MTRTRIAVGGKRCVIAPFGGADAMVTDLKDKVFPARPVNMLTAAGGKLIVRVV